jgi:flagellar motor component MotA
MYLQTIWVGDKVLSMLESDEREYRFLPVLLELIVWGSTDENIDDLLSKILSKKENEKKK